MLEESIRTLEFLRQQERSRRHIEQIDSAMIVLDDARVYVRKIAKVQSAIDRAWYNLDEELEETMKQYWFKSSSFHDRRISHWERQNLITEEQATIFRLGK